MIVSFKLGKDNLSIVSVVSQNTLFFTVHMHIKLNNGFSPVGSVKQTIAANLYERMRFAVI